MFLIKNVISVYMHNYMHVLKVAFLKIGLKSFIPRKKLQFSHPVASFMNCWLSFHTLVLEVLWISYPGILAAAVFIPWVFPSAPVPSIKNDRSLNTRLPQIFYRTFQRKNKTQILNVAYRVPSKNVLMNKYGYLIC